MAVLAAVNVTVVLEPEVEAVAETLTAVSCTTPTTRKGNPDVTRVLPEVPELTTPPEIAIAESPVVVLPVVPVMAYTLVPMKVGLI